jgi:hypothetical protein
MIDVVGVGCEQLHQTRNVFRNESGSGRITEESREQLEEVLKMKLVGAAKTAHKQLAHFGKNGLRFQSDNELLQVVLH